MKHLRIATAMRGALSIAVVLFFSLPTAVWAEDENVEPAQSEEQSEKKKEDKSSEKSDDKSAEVDLSGLELDLPKEEKKEEKKKPEVAGASEYQLQDALVFGQRHKDATSASEFNVELERLHIIPRKSAAEQLMLAPGVLTTNHGGEGHANETFMRGFAAGEGQDIEFTVDGVPINEISNPHAHGYADLHFIPPEFVHTVEITEGTFDASQGDFAFAGSANYRLGVSERGARLSTGAGSFNSQRMVLAYAPPDDSDETFAGFEFYTTDGHGENRAAQRAIALGRYTDDEGEGGLKWSLSAYGYAARYDSAGIVRQDDYEAGRMGFTDSYDSNQGGESARLLLALSTSFGSAKARFSQTVFIGQRTLRIRSNFTGWMTDVPYELDGTPVATQRGDGVEMRYSAFTGGSRGSYDLQSEFWGHKQEASLGYAIRYDEGRSSQVRLRSVTAIPYTRVFDFNYAVMNLAGYGNTRLKLRDWLVLKGGVRLDTFSFGVTNLNGATADREGAREADQTTQAFGYALSPRLTTDFRLLEKLHALISFGAGTRSTEAAALSDNETAPFARAKVYETGLRYEWKHPTQKLKFSTQTSYVFTQVDKDMLFDQTAGRNVPIGSSTRHAVLLNAKTEAFGFVDAIFNLGYAHATLDETGELIPYIPIWVLRLDIAARHKLGDYKVGGRDVTGQIGAGFTYVPGRPLPYNTFGDDYYLVNLGADVRLWHVGLGLEIRNLLNQQYRQSEFNYPSNFVSPDAPVQRVPMRHFVAGEPLYGMLTLTLYLEDIFAPAPSPQNELAGLEKH